MILNCKIVEKPYKTISYSCCKTYEYYNNVTRQWMDIFK